MKYVSVAAFVVLGIAAAQSRVLATEPAAAAAATVANQFEIELPDGWLIYDQNEATLERSGPHGVLIFASAALLDGDTAVARPEAIAQVDTGALPSFFVDRQSAQGSTCEKFTKSQAYRVGTELKKDPAFGVGSQMFGAAMPVKHKSITIGGCKGWHYQATPKDWVLDVRAVANGGVLYLFSLRNRTVHYESNKPAFEAALKTVRFISGALPGSS